ncbi:unnamed protein product [marine sediment metagenome]|uniref:Uncharacterized protein n=1 Tax=marine sediment metagenome TaxID=412755 RepID=X1E7J0_9ZZZZ
MSVGYAPTRRLKFYYFPHVTKNAEIGLGISKECRALFMMCWGPEMTIQHVALQGDSRWELDIQLAKMNVDSYTVTHPYMFASCMSSTKAFGYLNIMYLSREQYIDHLTFRCDPQNFSPFVVIVGNNKTLISESVHIQPTSFLIFPNSCCDAIH